MNRGLFHRIVTLLLVLFCTLPALGQFTRDKAAKQKIEEAINTHYFATEFQKAEDILVGTIQACGEKCSPQTLARAWMYVGVVRGSGKQDLAGASEAFNTALALDPGVKLDQDISSPETKKAFASAGGTGGAASPPAGGDETGADEDLAAIEAAADVSGEMLCTPEVREVQTNRTIPVSCTSAQEPAKVELRYKEFGNDQWQKVGMSKRGEGFWQAEIPCTATSAAGALRWYVEARSGAGDAIDNYGSQKEPVVMTIAEDSLAEPPAFPNQPAPTRCGEGGSATSADCPPDFPGCGEGGGGGECGYKEWGASCENSSECKCGLLCMEGSCDTAPSCEADADCPVGSCVSGTCAVQSETGPDGFYKSLWVGVHFAYDLGVVGGQDVCYSETQVQGRFACYESGSSNPYPNINQQRQSATPDDDGNPVVYPEEPYIGTGVASGVAPGTMRALLSLDYALVPNITVGGRVGYAFLGGNPTDFFPFHAEARLTYHFSGLGEGFGPYVGLSGGLAQFDLKVPATVRNCNAFFLRVERENEVPADGFPSYEDCFNAGSPNQRLLTQQEKDQLSQVNVDVYQKNGNAFVGGHVGAVYRFSENMGVQLNATLAYTLPNSTLIIEPTLGVVYGL